MEPVFPNEPPEKETHVEPLPTSVRRRLLPVACNGTHRKHTQWTQWWAHEKFSERMFTIPRCSMRVPQHAGQRECQGRLTPRPHQQHGENTNNPQCRGPGLPGTLGWSMRGAWFLVLSGTLVCVLAVPLYAAAATKNNASRLESGIASWFHSRHPLSAAHRTLPVGARVKVRTSSGRSVIVRVTGRGPFVGGRVIDLSSDAFKKLASLGTGVIRVKLEQVK